VDAANEADVFVCEAYFFDKQIRYHLDYTTLRTHQEQLNCRRIILTHMSDDMLHREDEAELRCAEDGLVVMV
jgi:ribonuclease BN (tRNA processing enzyme)